VNTDIELSLVAVRVCGRVTYEETPITPDTQDMTSKVVLDAIV
jgi:hypothetical protein